MDNMIVDFDERVEELPLPPSDDTTPATQQRTKWSDEDVEMLLELWDGGNTAKEIALFMGRTFNNVRNKVKQLQDKGVLKPRVKQAKLLESEVQHLAGAFGVPVEEVQFFDRLISGNDPERLNTVTQCIIAYQAQNGYCYYVDTVRLSFDTSPSGLVPMFGPQNQLILCCSAIANTRKTLSHTAFVNLCKSVAIKFG